MSLQIRWARKERDKVVVSAMIPIRRAISFPRIQFVTHSNCNDLIQLHFVNEFWILSAYIFANKKKISYYGKVILFRLNDEATE